MDELTSAAELPDDGTDVALRPQRLSDFAGQPQSTEQLAVVLQAALQRGEPAPHLLFSGPPGLGKTTLAQIVAHEMGVGTAFKSTSAPSLEKPGDLVALLTSREPGDVLFIDEVHRLPRVLEEILYPAMEDFVVDIVIGDGPDAKSLRLPLPPFTLVAATTRSGLLSAPLLDRFGLELNFEFYDDDTLAGIIARSARLLGTDITDQAAAELGCRSRGTPRIANRLLRRVRDYAQVQGNGTIDAATLAGGLALFGIDSIGLDKISTRVLDVLTGTYAGRPLGLKTLATAVGESPDTIEDSVEPFLIRKGLIDRTPRGRTATTAAYTHLNRNPPVNHQLRIA
ncbi:Holliday junction branch migration DNA helicase RuvB [Euzebya pacifica]|nr:Holliday junction branch migration DNA helicase RuvB [Euzebya pacifica]